MSGNNGSPEGGKHVAKYPWYLRGLVVHGHGRGGSKLGYPTANLQLDTATINSLMAYNNLVLFGYGCIEAGTSSKESSTPAAAGGPFPFAMSVGYNPQFQDAALSAEVHFLKTFEEDFYGCVVRIVVIDAIRPMYAFKSLEELIETIHGDVSKTKEKLTQAEVSVYETDPFVQPGTVLSPEVLARMPYFRVDS